MVLGNYGIVLVSGNNDVLFLFSKVTATTSEGREAAKRRSYKGKKKNETVDVHNKNNKIQN